MRILMISDVYFPRVNGVSTSIKTFIGELHAQGHKVTLIVPMYGEEDELHDDDIEAKVLRIPSRRVPLDPEDRIFKRRLISLHYRSLKHCQFDIMHIHTPFVAHYAGVALAKKLGIPVVETYHTYFEEYLHHYMRFLPRAWLQYAARRFSRAQSADIDAMVVPSVLMRDVLDGYGVSTPLRVIPTGLDDACFTRGDGIKFREKHNIAPDRPVLCHVGRAAHEKNIDFLIDMLARVKQTIPDILLLLAGEGPALPYLKQKAISAGLEDNVRFIGYLDRKTALKDCYCAGDVFVFASRTETQGLVLLEAMALGLPVVSTAVLGTVDILQPEQGALIAGEELDDFAEKVIHLLKDEVLKEIKQAEAVDYAHSWSASEMATRLTCLYTEVIDQHRQEPTLLQARMRAG